MEEPVGLFFGFGIFRMDSSMDGLNTQKYIIRNGQNSNIVAMIMI
jgi:hypothetical protein